MNRIRQKSAEEREQILCRTSYEVRRGLLAPSLRLHCVHRHVRILQNTSRMGQDTGRIRAECRADNATFPSIIRQGLKHTHIRHTSRSLFALCFA